MEDIMKSDNGDWWRGLRLIGEEVFQEIYPE